MRFVLLVCLVACARALPPESVETASEHVSEATPPVPAPARTVIVAPALSARELVEQAGISTFVEDRQFGVAAVDPDAMERWFVRPPGHVFFYTERPVEVAELGGAVRGRCQRVSRWDSGVINALAVVLWRQGGLRTVVHLGQERVAVVDQQHEMGEWITTGARTLPMTVIAWGDDQVGYGEGAEIYEVACVPALRTVSCGGGELLGPRGYCVDRRLVVRPWRAPFVPHVGAVIPAYRDPYPAVPEGDCAVRCERSACAEAVRMALIPRAALYAEEAPVLSAFRTRAGCRAFASARAGRAEAADDRPDQGVW